jgi:hypothetical protein
MRLIALGTVSAIATILSFGVEAADLFYPPSEGGPPQYGTAPPAAVAPPQVLVVPGAPVAVPRFNGAPAAPAEAGTSPYEAPPVVGVAPGRLPPRAACDPIWRCGNASCGWEPSCGPQPEYYGAPYKSPGPPLYSEALPPPGHYAGPYGGAGPQVSPGPPAPPAPAPYSGPYAPHASGPYAPQVYSGPTGPMRWMIGPQPYGM